MGRSRTIGLVTAFTTAALISMTGVASAAPLEHGHFHDEFTNIVTDFCDVPGLTVQAEGVADGSFLAAPRGPDGLIYFKENLRASSVLTNLANGRTISDEARTVSKDLKVVDNGDGTLTLTVLATGNFVLYGADGKAIARNPGQFRFQLLIDHNDTPSDPFDDLELEFLGPVKESTGRTDDHCAAAVAALT